MNGIKDELGADSGTDETDVNTDDQSNSTDSDESRSGEDNDQKKIQTVKIVQKIVLE